MARHFSDTATAEAVLEDIMNGRYSTNIAYGLLNQIIQDLPGTQVAQQAKKYKDEHY